MRMRLSNRLLTLSFIVDKILRLTAWLLKGTMQRMVLFQGTVMLLIPYFLKSVRMEYISCIRRVSDILNCSSNSVSTVMSKNGGSGHRASFMLS